MNTIPNLDGLHWQMIIDRCAGDFIYAVETMRIYCVPDCPSPRPLRRNMRLFDRPAQAEAAGYRACGRCDPRGVVADARRFIEAAPAIPSLGWLAARAGYSRCHALRPFCDHTGLTPRSFAQGARFADAVQGGSAGRLPGTTPGLRRSGAGEIIRTAFADSPFGRLLIGATETGVCYLGFAEPDDALLGDLRMRFPQAMVVTDDAGLAATVAIILSYLAEPRTGLALPLDLRGTAFQQRVWAALCRIPPGQTRSYSEVAAAIEAPRAVRAVARSCATNPVSLAVPCHRVVGANGALTGYRWGIPHKRALLEAEQG